jgi:hypothetical protein
MGEACPVISSYGLFRDGHPAQAAKPCGRHADDHAWGVDEEGDGGVLQRPLTRRHWR